MPAPLATAGAPRPGAPDSWVDDRSAPLLVDLYELTMAQAYWREGMHGEAVFDLYFRTLPAGRNLVLACGLADAVRFLAHLDFAPHRDTLAVLGIFQPAFLDWLCALRFRGELLAMPEGTPVFAEEPLLEVVAPLATAQLAETFLMNQVCFQSTLAAKAVRVVTAAGGRSVVDFGVRRMHGTDVGVKSVRAFRLAGVAATSNVLGGAVYDVPVTGTMAHAFVQAHEDELEAFRAFNALYPGTVLLVDTYDTLAGIDKVIALARELGDGFRVRAVRLDSGDVAELARRARARLDAAGLARVEIFVSGGLDEEQVAALVAAGAPIDGFGVGTDMAVSRDAPVLDMVYKLVEYAGEARLKLSPGKRVLPGRKQVYRVEEGGEVVRDVIALHDEPPAGRPLLVEVMRRGELVDPSLLDLEAARARAARELALLPARVRALAPADPPYAVEASAALLAAHARARRRVEERA